MLTEAHRHVVHVHTDDAAVEARGGARLKRTRELLQVGGAAEPDHARRLELAIPGHQVRSAKTLLGAVIHSDPEAQEGPLDVDGVPETVVDAGGIGTRHQHQAGGDAQIVAHHQSPPRKSHHQVVGGGGRAVRAQLTQRHRHPTRRRCAQGDGNAVGHCIGPHSLHQQPLCGEPGDGSGGAPPSQREARRTATLEPHGAVVTVAQGAVRRHLRSRLRACIQEEGGTPKGAKGGGG